MDIMDSIFFSRWIFTTIFLSVLSGAGAGIFSTPSLVWLEHENGDVRIQQAPIHSRTWAVDSKGLQPVPIDVTKAAEYTHIAVDHGNQTFVAVDQRTNRIVAITFDDSQLGIAIYWQLYSGTSKKVNGIAVDWTTDVVYWTDAAYDVIMAVSMAVPNMAEVVVGNDLDKPYGIVTHPKKGYLFWADCGSRAHIKRSSLGGRNQHVVRTFRDRRPTVLTVDYAEDRLYWLYRHEDGGLGSCDLYGSGSSYISYDLQEGVQYCDLDIFRGQLVAVRQQRNFYEIHIFPPRHGQPSRKHTVIGRPYGIVAVDQEKQQDRPNPCLRSRCPGICTKSNSTEDCFCHDAWRATENEAIVDMYCQAPAFTGLLLPKGDGIYTIGRNFAEFDRYSRLVPRRILETSHAVKAVTSNVRSSRIFFYVAYTKLIQSVKTEQGSAHTVVSMAVGDVGGLAYDGVSDNLYWTDRVHRHIMVTTGDGQYPVVLLANLNQPSAIAVHPLERLLFWSDLGEMTLERACMDGSDRRRLHPGRRYRVAALALDFQSNRLYFVSRVGWSSSVFQSGLDGNFLEELYSPRYSRFTGITVMHDYLVISDTYYRTSGLYAVDKVTCQFVGNVSYPRHRYGNWYGVAYHHVASQPYRRGSPRMDNKVRHSDPAKNTDTESIEDKIIQEMRETIGDCLEDNNIFQVLQANSVHDNTENNTISDLNNTTRVENNRIGSGLSHACSRRPGTASKPTSNDIRKQSSSDMHFRPSSSTKSTTCDDRKISKDQCCNRQPGTASKPTSNDIRKQSSSDMHSRPSCSSTKSTTCDDRKISKDQWCNKQTNTVVDNNHRTQTVNSDNEDTVKCRRLQQRRNALCDHRKLLISQTTRERLERDVERRKTSLARRFSRYFIVNFDLDKEEDLL